MLTSSPRSTRTPCPPRVRLFAFIIAFLSCATVVSAQTVVNPRVVSFLPSADHSALDANGQPLVTSYDMEIYQQGVAQALRVANLGKPDPGGDGYILVDFMSILGTPPATGVTLEARVAAVGPSGRGESTPSNTFTFDAPTTCSPSVTPTAVTGPAQGGTGTITVSVATGCTWQAATATAWLSITGGASGSGGGSVNYFMAANTSTSPRNGSLTIAGHTVGVTQDGAVLPNVEPSVSLTSPASGATFTSPASVAISASAYDGDGTIRTVQFYADGTLVGTRSANPYSVTWSGVAAGTYTLTAVATDDDGAATTSAGVSITVKAPNQAPTVFLTTPAPGAMFSSPAVIGMVASAADGDGTVSLVRFYANNSVVGTAGSNPFSFTWTGAQPGTYTITAEAVDNEGAGTMSAGVSITVRPPNMMPSVTVTSPTANQTFTTQSHVALAATASDTDGVIASVEFYANGLSIGVTSTGPYAVSWTPAAAGAYTITAAATDNSNARTMSAGVPITVTAVNAPPVVTLTSPANGAAFAEPASLVITATAGDPDGTVSRVDFYANGTTLVGTKSAAPYSVGWSNVAAGTYALTAVAFDNAGARTTSPPVTVTVAAATPPVPNVPPNVDVTSPAAGSSLVAPINLTIDAVATDSDGRVARVDFYVNGSLVGWSATAPYSVRWSVRSTGTFTIQAVATDDRGGRKTSAQVAVTAKKKGNSRK